jgi:hypothetical protein
VEGGGARGSEWGKRPYRKGNGIYVEYNTVHV